MMKPIPIRDLKRIYHAVKTGFESMTGELAVTSEPESYGDHLIALNAMFLRADALGIECWIPEAEHDQ